MQWSKLVPELAVEDFEESLRFYTEIIGFQIAFSRLPGFAYLDWNGVQLMLEAAPPGWMTGELVRPYGRGVNFEIAWEDVADLRDKFVSLGYTLYRDIEERWRQTGVCVTGSREFLIQDPDGYLLRFAQNLGEVDGEK